MPSTRPFTSCKGPCHCNSRFSEGSGKLEHEVINVTIILFYKWHHSIYNLTQFQLILCAMFFLSPVKGGVDAKELFHLYIVIWIQDKRLYLLESCKLDKVCMLSYGIMSLWYIGYVRRFLAPLTSSGFTKIVGAIFSFMLISAPWNRVHSFFFQLDTVVLPSFIYDYVLWCWWMRIPV